MSATASAIDAAPHVLQQRRSAVSDSADVYGVDFVQVIEAGDRSWTLSLNFIPDQTIPGGGSGIPPDLGVESIQLVRLGAGDQTFAIEADLVRLQPDEKHGFRLTVTPVYAQSQEVLAGRLALVVGRSDIDPLFNRGEFSLGDERAEPPPEPAEATDSAPAQAAGDYLAKDYDAFVQLLGDRLKLIAPRWAERNPADIGVMLMELFAYAGDYLSYHQDASATEAYLSTARRRTSLRRHARLLDYPVSDGCNARVWLHVGIYEDRLLPAGTQFSTRSDTGTGDTDATAIFFETMYDAQLYKALGQPIPLYDWGASTPITIPAGATQVMLTGHLPLRAGDVVIFQEQYSLGANGPEAPDPTHRHVVRIVGDPVLDTLKTFGAQPVTSIAWDDEEALPFPLTVGTLPPIGDEPRCYTAALGNIVLADHGATRGAPLRLVGRDPESQIAFALRGRSIACAQSIAEEELRALPSAAALEQAPEQALPCVRVREHRADRTVEWSIRRDLLASGPSARHFVAELDDTDNLRLRFGDGAFGRPLQSGSALQVLWREGGGPEGNVAADSIVYPDVLPGGYEVLVWNPLPASGGRDGEPDQQIRTDAPKRLGGHQDRLLTAEDFATAAERVSGVRSAAARFVWNGSRRLANVYILTAGGVDLDPTLVEAVREYLDERRVAGIDLDVRPPRFVPVHVRLRVMVRPGVMRAAVAQQLEAELGSAALGDGRVGFFHRDAYGFGQPVYLAPIVARAAAVPGVDWVDALTFERWNEGSQLAAGVVPIANIEIAQPRAADQGFVELDVEGGE